MKRGSLFAAALCAALMSASMSNARAQGAYPTKPMRWVISNAPGGGADVIARPIAAKVSELLGQTIVYENRGGAGGLIAGEAHEDDDVRRDQERHEVGVLEGGKRGGVRKGRMKK